MAFAARWTRRVSDSIDEKTGLPVRSLYGDTPESRRPRPEDLAGLDAVVVDLQDAGCRFYTYLTTLGYVLEEAAKAKVKVVVLDRPNPIRADRWEGPPADLDALSFVAYHAIPIRTGMTIGELAGLFNAERKIGADLTVVKMSGYSRDLWYDETGLPWVNPSPNLRSVTEAALYPGIGLLETTNVSVGRGTDVPFEQFGAPWMDGPRVAATLNTRGVPGVRFTPVRFTPTSSVFKGETCSGVRITVVDRDALNAVALGFHVGDRPPRPPPERVEVRPPRPPPRERRRPRALPARRDGRRDRGRVGRGRDGVRGEAGEVPALLTALRPLQVLLEEPEDVADPEHLVGALGRPVPSVREEDQRRRHAALLERLVDLHRLADRDARVVRALDHEQRRLERSR